MPKLNELYKYWILSNTPSGVPTEYDTGSVFSDLERITSLTEKLTSQTTIRWGTDTSIYQSTFGEYGDAIYFKKETGGTATVLYGGQVTQELINTTNIKVKNSNYNVRVMVINKPIAEWARIGDEQSYTQFYLRTNEKGYVQFKESDLNYYWGIACYESIDYTSARNMILYKSRSILKWWDENLVKQSHYYDLNLFNRCSNREASALPSALLEMQSVKTYGFNLDSRTEIAYTLWRKYNEKWNNIFETWQLSGGDLIGYKDVFGNVQKTKDSTHTIPVYEWDHTFNFLDNNDRYELYGGSDTTNASVNSQNNRNAFNSGTSVDTDGNESESNNTINYGQMAHVHGNIGVTRSDEMLVYTRRIWLDNYFDMVCDDIIKELSLPIYNN